MAAMQPFPSRTDFQLLTSCSSCNQPRASPSRGHDRAVLRAKSSLVSLLSFTPGPGYRVERKPSPSWRCRQFASPVILFRELNPRQGCRELSAVRQRIFGGRYSIGKCSMRVACGAGSASQVSCPKGPTAKFRDKFNKGFRKIERQSTKLEERIQKGFRKAGLEKEFRELPQWSSYVPVVAGGLEAAVLIGWTVFLKGDLRGSNIFNLSGEGLLTLLLGTNFIVGWLASQMSTWRVQALSPSFIGRDKRPARPGLLDFIRSFVVNLIPYGNFMAWTRFAWKESNSVSSVNALVYVVPSLLRLVLWSRGLSIAKVEFLAWVLGSIHRPYDVARVKNERVLAAADATAEDARKAEEKKEQREKGPELTVEEMAHLQQRKELEEFDILLARSTDGTTSLPGAAQDWSVGDTLQWLGQEGFARYASTFADNDIDGNILLLLTADDLRDELGVQSLGDRKKLAQAIQLLKSRN